MDEGRRTELLEIITTAATEARKRTPERIITQYHVPWWVLLVIILQACALLAASVRLVEIL